MKGQPVLFSRKSDEWTTPRALWDALDREFHFELDAAAETHNTLCYMYFGPGSPWAQDALSVEWTAFGARTTWCNPPYSRVREFVAKAVEAQALGATVVMLLPARTDTRWWHAHVWETENHRPRPGVEVRFLKGRLRFGGGENSAPFPSVVVVFRGRRG